MSHSKGTGDIPLLQLAILRDEAPALVPSMRVLDVGCGNGDTVRGWLDRGVDAYGCDFRFKKGQNVEALTRSERLSIISGDPYCLPYPDAHFDVIVTNQVFEHVLNYDTTLREMRRVLKPTGCALHMFPARGLPIEPHVFVPLATTIRNDAWLHFWALLGIRRKDQRTLGWREVAMRNHIYLTTNTNYLSGNDIRRNFLRHFSSMRYVERAFLRHSPHMRGRILYSAGRVLPFIFLLYRHLWARVVLVTA